MLEYLAKYLISSISNRPTKLAADTFLIQAIADKLERDVSSLESKGRVVCTFKGLFYSRILTSLWEHLDCINNNQSSSGQVIPLSKIFQLLERLCQWPIQSTVVFEDGPGFDPQQFPTLIRLVESQSSALPAVTGFIKAKSCWNKSALSLWRDLFEEPSGSLTGGKGPDAAELKTVVLSRSFKDVHEDISKLHEAMTQHLSSDDCRYLWDSMIVNLESGRSHMKESKSETLTCFRLFLTNSHASKDLDSAYWWQDVQVSIDRQRSVRFEEPKQGKDLMTVKNASLAIQHTTRANLDLSLGTRTPEYDDLCNLFQTRILFQHCLIYSSSFKQLAASYPIRKFRQDHPSIPLSEIIGCGKLTTKTKAFLSSRLVRMLWEIHDSAWIHENWNKNDIQFMLERSKKDRTVSVHEPFLQARLSRDKLDIALDQARPTKTYSLRPHRYPKLLALGIMLLEIELDQSIEELVQLDFQDPDPVNTKHIMALNILDNQHIWPPKEIYSFLKEIIELCIMPDYSKLEKTEDFRRNFLEEVVQPFDNFLVEAWPKDQITFPLSLDTSPAALRQRERSRFLVQTQIPIEKPSAVVTTHNNDDYTVGWITALEIEMAVARGMLDEIHNSLYQIEGDTNNYILGRLGLHKVVIACLPSMGNNNAALVATNMMRSFRNVRIGLIVGIGGGVPAANDMRLGDVVVSGPVGTHGGVIQYDFGTATQTTESFTRKGHLNQPPTAILTAIKTMRANALLQDYEFGKYFDAMIQRYPKIGEQCQRPLRDQLYDGAYLHQIKGAGCSQCGTIGLINRKPRSTTKVHYGIIGSGNEVIRDAALRDALYKRDNIICFEMEAAGLMNDFPCIVIRGICDYCDSHKDKEWQPYAAGIAAAFAKELLLTISPTHVKAASAASNVLVT